MTITTVGIDIAKNEFVVRGVDQNCRTVLVKPKVSRAALPELIAGLLPWVIGMEACSRVLYWAMLFRVYGHEPCLMAAKFVSVDDLLEHIDRIEANIAEDDRLLSCMAKDDHRNQRLMELKEGPQ